MPGDYRIFVGAFPAGEIGERIQALRKRLDAKTACISPPHVTLAGTYWRTGPPTVYNEAATIARLEEAGHTIPAFDLLLGGIQSFLPWNAVLYLSVEPTASLLAVRKSLLDAIGQDKHGVEFTPHLTLAMRLGTQACQAAQDELRQSQWHSDRWSVPIDQLHLMQRGPGDPAWRCIHRMTLAGPAH